MLKKTLIGLVVLSFLAVPVMAAEQAVGDAFQLKAHDWPAVITFQPVDLDFKVPVYMDVGLYFEINNKKDLVNTGIVITQKSINIYEGCSIAMNIQTNFDMVLSATIAATDLGSALGGTWKVEVRDEACEVKSENVPKTLSPVTEKRKIWVQLKDPKVYELDFGKKKHVANVTLNVKPKSIEFIWVDP